MRVRRRPGLEHRQARIIDKDDGFTQYTTTVVVNNVAPTVVITGAPATRPEGTLISLGSAASDSSSADVTAGFTYAWSVTKNGNPYTTGSSSSFSFTPDDNGTYVVSLTATDKDGGVGTAPQKTISVTNVAPTAATPRNALSPKRLMLTRSELKLPNAMQPVT
jgi:hypothetical protein